MFLRGEMVKSYGSFHFNIRVCIGADNRNMDVLRK